MNFSEATECLKAGHSIRRKSWPEFLHIRITTIEDDDGDTVQSVIGYRQETVLFNYTANILLSEDWCIVGNEEETIDFCTAVIKLQQKYKVKLKAWPKDTYLEINEYRKDLYMKKMVTYDFVPTFECISSSDWEILE